MNSYTLAALQERRAGSNKKYANRALFIYVLLCFFPYPALEVGRSSGIQMAHLLGLLYIPFIGPILLRKPLFITAYFALVLPSFVAIFAGDSDTLNLNSAVFQALGLLSMPIVASLTAHCGVRPVVKAAVVAIVIHAAVGIWQQISYLDEQFPLISLYVNPSFALMEPEAVRTLYGVYTKRSFGIFPEPSSMFASLSPFMVFLIYNKNNYMNWNKRLNLAIFLGLILFYFSKSGGILYFLLACAPYGWKSFKRQMKRKSSSKLLYLFVVLLGLAVLSWVFWDAFQNRAQSELDQDDGSWAQRSASILFALNTPFNGSVLKLFFGYGLGDVSVLAGEATGRPSVHSWVVQNFMGAGLIGTLLLAVVFAGIYRRIRKSQNKLAGYMCAFMWLVCATVVTGYFQLLSMWAFLGVLMAWSYIKWEKR